MLYNNDGIIYHKNLRSQNYDTRHKVYDFDFEGIIDIKLPECKLKEIYASSYSAPPVIYLKRSFIITQSDDQWSVLAHFYSVNQD